MKYYEIRTGDESYLDERLCIINYDSYYIFRLPVYSVEQVKSALDQALYCLYSHPSKKSSRARHLVDHNISQVRNDFDSHI